MKKMFESLYSKGLYLNFGEAKIRDGI